jgi:Co/Zn/Cd efflux system component
MTGHDHPPIRADHDHPHGHGHGHDHDHDHDHDHGEHEHSHPHGGVKGFLYDLFVPHTHDSADSIDDAMEASTAGVRALKISLFILLATTVLQAVIVAFTGSIALLADTIHNFADALTAVPLWIAFLLGRRVANRRYTYGYGRAEDLAGMFIVFVVALSAVVAGWQAIDRFINPRPIENPWLLVLAGLIGFAGNEAVAIYRIRVGQKIGSAALVADGVHARLDGFTSLSVVLGDWRLARVPDRGPDHRAAHLGLDHGPALGDGEVHRRAPHGRHRPRPPGQGRARPRTHRRRRDCPGPPPPLGRPPPHRVRHGRGHRSVPA